MIYLDSAATTFPKYTSYSCTWLNANTFPWCKFWQGRVWRYGK